MYFCPLHRQVCDDLDVKAIMDTWIKQKGYPVVYIADSNVQVRDGSRKLAASQKRFLRDVKKGTKTYDDETKGYELLKASSEFFQSHLFTSNHIASIPRACFHSFSNTHGLRSHPSCRCPLDKSF